MCMVKPILAERFGLFAVRYPSLSWGKWTVGLWHNFDIFTHGRPWVFFFLCVKFINIMLYIGKIHLDDLEEGYKVVRPVKETTSLYKINHYTIIFSLYKDNRYTISLYE